VFAEDPELDTVLQVRPHQSGAVGQNHLPLPAGHDSFDAAQDTVGFLGYETAHLNSSRISAGVAKERSRRHKTTIFSGTDDASLKIL